MIALRQPMADDSAAPSRDQDAIPGAAPATWPERSQEQPAHRAPSRDRLDLRDRLARTAVRALEAVVTLCDLRRGARARGLARRPASAELTRRCIGSGRRMRPRRENAADVPPAPADPKNLERVGDHASNPRVELLRAHRGLAGSPEPNSQGQSERGGAAGAPRSRSRSKLWRAAATAGGRGRRLCRRFGLRLLGGLVLALAAVSASARTAAPFSGRRDRPSGPANTGREAAAPQRLRSRSPGRAPQQAEPEFLLVGSGTAPGAGAWPAGCPGPGPCLPAG